MYAQVRKEARAHACGIWRGYLDGLDGCVGDVLALDADFDLHKTTNVSACPDHSLEDLHGHKTCEQKAMSSAQRHKLRT